MVPAKLAQGVPWSPREWQSLIASSSIVSSLPGQRIRISPSGSQLGRHKLLTRHRQAHQDVTRWRRVTGRLWNMQSKCIDFYWPRLWPAIMSGFAGRQQVITGASLLSMLLGRFRKFKKKKTTDYQLRHVCPSVLLKQLRSLWTDFHEIWYLSIFFENLSGKLKFY